MSISGYRGFALAALGLFLQSAGCDSIRAGANPQAPSWRYRPSGSLSVVFKRSIVAESRKPDVAYERGQPELDTRGRRVFVGSSDRGLYALSAVDGATLWRFETVGFVNGAPLYDPQQDVVYFGSNDGALYKVAAETGKLLWRFATNAEIARRPVLSGRRLFVVNANDTVLALDTETGKRIWSQHRTPALGFEIAGYSGALAWRDKLYVGFSDGTVTALDQRTGNERWQPVDLSAEAEQELGDVPTYLDVDTTPVGDEIEAGAVVYVGNYAGGVFALDAETGTQVWSNPAVAGVNNLVLWSEPARTLRGAEESGRKLLLAASGTTGLWALDPETGQEKWRRTLPRGGVSSPVPIQGALLISASQLGVFLISPLDGGIIDGIHMADGTSVTPAVFGRRAFVVSNHGELISLHVTPPKG